MPVPDPDDVELVPDVIDDDVEVCAILYPLICIPQIVVAVVYDVVAVNQLFDWSRMA